MLICISFVLFFGVLLISCMPIRKKSILCMKNFSFSILDGFKCFKMPKLNSTLLFDRHTVVPNAQNVDIKEKKNYKCL